MKETKTVTIHLSAAALTFWVAPSWVLAGWIQWPTSEGGNGHWYQVVSAPRGNISWTDAKMAAEASGGYLATVTSHEENLFVHGLVATNPALWDGDGGPWLGGYQPPGSLEPAGGWKWVTDEPWEYTSWEPEQPDNRWRDWPENYLQYRHPHGTVQAYWNDAPNDLSVLSQAVRGYVVESLVPEPGGLALLVLGAVTLIQRRRRR